MSGVSRWRDSGHLERAVETAGGREAFDAAVAAVLDDARDWRLDVLSSQRSSAGRDQIGDVSVKLGERLVKCGEAGGV
jgi:hypothetical protein